MTRLPSLALIVILITPACAARDEVPVLVGQATVALTASIGELQQTTKQLTDAHALPLGVARDVQARLLVVNDGVARAIPYLDALDASLRAGETADQHAVAQVIAILRAVSHELATVLAGVPMTEETRAIVDLVHASQQAVTTTLTEVAQLRGSAAQ